MGRRAVGEEGGSAPTVILRDTRWPCARHKAKRLEGLTPEPVGSLHIPKGSRAAGDLGRPRCVAILSDSP